MTRLSAIGTAIAIGVAALVGAGAAWQLKPAPPPGPPRVRVDTVAMESSRPDVSRPSLGERITTHNVRPTQTRTAEAPSGAGILAVRRYCEPAHQLGDTARPTMSDTTKGRPELPDFRGRRDGPRLTLFSTLGDGRRWESESRVRGRITWQSDGDSVIVRGDQLWVRVTRGAVKCAPAIGAGGLAGVLSNDRPAAGLAVGAAAAVLGCLF